MTFGIGIIPGVIVSFCTDNTDMVILTHIISVFTVFMIFLVCANGILFSLARKTMETNLKASGWVSSRTFYNREANSCASVLVIDEVNRKIAYVSVHNPLEFQTADVKDLTNVISSYIRGPFDGTRYVYYQFVYNNKRMRIPTFTSRHMHFTSASIVQNAIAKADRFRDSVLKMQEEING